MQEKFHSSVIQHATLNRVALVTGGGGGIGSEICRELACADYQVVINF